MDGTELKVRSMRPGFDSKCPHGEEQETSAELYTAPLEARDGRAKAKPYTSTQGKTDSRISALPMVDASSRGEYLKAVERECQWKKWTCSQCRGDNLVPVGACFHCGTKCRAEIMLGQNEMAEGRVVRGVPGSLEFMGASEMGMHVVPMGRSCSTSFFLARHGLRRRSFPLDWSIADLRVWDHMLSDGFHTLLQDKEADSDTHPYNSFFGLGKNKLFLHQGGWADKHTVIRVERLRAVLARRQAFGLAVYFEDHGCRTTDVWTVLDEARKVADGDHGFCHIVLVWIARTGNRHGNEHWSSWGGHLSMLRYLPIRDVSKLKLALGGEGPAIEVEALSPMDSQNVAQLLLGRFPNFFDKIPQQKPCEETATIMLSLHDEDG